MNSFRMRAIGTAVSLFALAAATPALAQAASEDNGGVGDIVVTAQRTSQKLQDVPLSIVAQSGDQLANAGIRQMSDLQLTTPGFTPSNASGYNQMFIRGVGNSIFVGADPSVATFIDDVPRVFGTLVNNFVDVSRVEVIKGAPGALYGRNSTGGAVNIITRQPSTEGVAANGRISYGEKSTFQASAFFNIPLGDKAAWTVAGERRTHDGYIRNITNDTSPYTAAMFPVNGSGGPGTASFLGTPAQTAAFFNSGLKPRESYNDENFWAVSSKLMIRPSENFKITFAGDYSNKNDDNGNSGFNQTPFYPATLVLPGFLGFAGATPTGAALAPLINNVTEKFTTAQRTSGYVKLKDWGVSATMVLNLSGVDLTSITSYRKNESEFLTELGFVSYAMLQAHVPLKKKSFYQEIRAVSTGEGPLHWVAGASYLRNQFDGGLFTNIIPPFPFTQELQSGDGGYVINNWSAYAQLTYDFSDRISLMASGRYIDEKNDARSFNPGTGKYEAFPLHEKRFLPAVTLTYKLPGGGNVYARWARGFKAGGIVPVVAVSACDAPSTSARETEGCIFKGEDIDTFEIGVKAPLANNRVQLTAAAFYNDYRNVQLAAHAKPEFPLITISVVNAKKARTYGFEAGIEARVSDPLRVGAAIGYLNAEYTDAVIPPTNPVLSPLNLSHTRMINSPEWQISMHADLDQPINDKLNLTGNVLAAYTSRTLWQASAIPGFLPDSFEPGYWLVNARLGIKASDEKWALTVFAKNLFNQGYTTFGNSAEAYGTIGLWGEPRIVGAEATFKF